jgi:hypothetical protein
MNTVFNETPQKPLPNATATLVLGIISIVICGAVGLVTGIISLHLSSKDLRLYEVNPENYTASSISNIHTGRTCAIIGTILSSVVFLFLLLYFLFIFGMFATIFSAAF